MTVDGRASWIEHPCLCMYKLYQSAGSGGAGRRAGYCRYTYRVYIELYTDCCRALTAIDYPMGSVEYDNDKVTSPYLR